MIGLGPDYVRERGLSFYTAESHVCFVRPARLGDQVVVTFRILDYDEKRIQTYEEMHHVDGWLAATSEILSLHVDLSGPKVVSFPADIMLNIQAMAAAHSALPSPQRAGKHIDIANSPAKLDFAVLLNAKNPDRRIEAGGFERFTECQPRQGMRQLVAAEIATGHQLALVESPIRFRKIVPRECGGCS